MAFKLPLTVLSRFQFYRICCRPYCATKTNDDNKYDVIISGGGMVGVAMACALGMSANLVGKRILLTEAASLKPSQNSNDNYSVRVSALSRSTKEFMESVGVWDIISRKRHQCVKRLQVWDACSDARITFNHADMLKDVAYIVENNVIIRSFMEQLEKIKDRVEVKDCSRIENFELPENEWEDVSVHMRNGNIYKTKLLIGADGIKSQVRDAMNISYVSESYNQMAIVATLHLSEPTENNVAWQRFLPGSTIALLPLNEKMCSLVWSASLSKAKSLLHMDDEAFVDAINDALWSDKQKNLAVTALARKFSNLLRSIIPEGAPVRQLPPSIVRIDPGNRAAFQLGLGHASFYVKNRVALVGDAAHRVHPHAGLGANLGFGDVDCLSKILDEAVYRGCDIGNIIPLMKYEQERQQHVVPVMLGIDAIHRIFKTDFSPIVLLRNLGLQGINATYPIKEYLLQKT